MTATFEQSRTLPLVILNPLWSDIPTKVIDDEMGVKASALRADWNAFGGYWSLRFQLTDTQTKVENWIEQGLGRQVKLYNPGLELIWEGFVNSARANIGSLSIARGPLLNVANKVKVVYSTVDTSVTPPAMGVRKSTDYAEDSDSQGKYGIHERIISVGGATADNAEQVRDVALDEMKEPETSEMDNTSRSAVPSVSVECLGYMNFLKAYTFSSTTTGDQDASAKIEAILAADPNGIFSSDYSDIETNATQVGAYEQSDRVAFSLIKGITAMGIAGGDRFVFGFYKDRRAKYNEIPSAVQYQRSLSDPEQRIENYDGQGRIFPWGVTPGNWVFYTDLLIGKSAPAITQPSVLRTDPRFLFIEKATYTVPWGLTLQGNRIGQLGQLLARMGLGGTS